MTDNNLEQPRNVIDEIRYRYDKIEEFVPDLTSMRKQFIHKRKQAEGVIKEKMKELHDLINEWEKVFIDTAAETISEKVEILLGQDESLRGHQKKMLRFLNEYSNSTILKNVSLDKIEKKDVERIENIDEEEKEELMASITAFRNISFPLKPMGIKGGELASDVSDFGLFLDESKKSLRRSLSFIGGIVRGYFRRGKNQEWIDKLRKLESRIEINDDKNLFKRDIVKISRTNHINKELFQNEIQVWKLVSDLFKYRDNLALRTELCKQVRDLDTRYVEFYLPQLVNISINIKHYYELENLLLKKSRDSIHFTYLEFLLISSFAYGSNHKWIQKCKNLKWKVESVIGCDNVDIDKIVNSDSINHNLENIRMEITKVDTHKRFLSQFIFLHELVQIPSYLLKLHGKKDIHKTEMINKLQLLDPLIQQGVFLPYTSSKRHRVVGFNLEESFTISTSDRELLWLVMDVFTVPVEWNMDDTNTFLKKLQEKNELEVKDDEGNDEYDSALKYFVREKRKNLPPYAMYKNFSTRTFIVKNDDFVLQEQFVMQLITQFQRIFDIEGVPLHLCSYTIMALTCKAGLIEVVPNTISISDLKKKTGFTTLLDFFIKEWQEPEVFETCKKNFIRSVAAYSLVCYFLQIKDRHNGNILLDNQGYIIHIDFGYLLSRTIDFEKAPFKLTEEFMEVMAHGDKQGIQYFISLFYEGFLAIQKHYEKILMLVEMTLSTATTTEAQLIPCLADQSVLRNLRKRFKIGMSDKETQQFVINIISEANNNWRTTLYDTYQIFINNIFK